MRLVYSAHILGSRKNLNRFLFVLSHFAQREREKEMGIPNPEAVSVSYKSQFQFKRKKKGKGTRRSWPPQPREHH